MANCMPHSSFRESLLQRLHELSLLDPFKGNSMLTPGYGTLGWNHGTGFEGGKLGFNGTTRCWTTRRDCPKRARASGNGQPLHLGKLN